MTSNAKMLSAENAVTKDVLTYEDFLQTEDNDYGNAQALLKFINGSVIYDSSSSEWLLYDSGRWKRDNERKERIHKKVGEMYRFLYDSLKKEYEELESYGIDIPECKIRDFDKTEIGEAELDTIYKQIKECQRQWKKIKVLGNGSRIRRIIQAAEAQLVDDKAKLNPYNHYLVVENGTVNLETGELPDHSPEHYPTICAPIVYNPQAKEPTRFFQFLEEIMQGDKDLIEYVHRVLGYCLTGETRQHEFYILYGPGGNGKGVLLTLIKSILGEYLAEVTEGALAKSISGNTTNPTILQAKDCRIMLTNESEKGTRLNASLIKQISAGEEICPRTLYKANEHFIPHMKLLCATNHLPEIDWNDGGIRRRIRIIPFPVVIPDEKKDTLLDKKLLEEREGVLKWLIEGAVSYYKDGMVKIPEAVQNAMNRERFRTDTISWFFNCAVVPTGEKADRYQAHRVYEAYLQFCTYKGIDLPESETMFGRRFKQLIQDTSINWKKCSDGMYYEGLKLLSDDADNGVAA